MPLVVSVPVQNRSEVISFGDVFVVPWARSRKTTAFSAGGWTSASLKALLMSTFAQMEALSFRRAFMRHDLISTVSGFSLFRLSHLDVGSSVRGRSLRAVAGASSVTGM